MTPLAPFISNKANTISVFAFLMTLLLWAPDTFAAGNYVCQGRSLPASKSRQWRNHRLECAPAVDHFIRRPQPFDMKTWQRASNDPMEQQKIRLQEQPVIAWSGSVPYQTIEKWTWVDWVYGPDPVCGYEEHCTTDSKGNKSCYSTMKSCWHDETRYESRHCTTLRMDFTAEFIKPAQSEAEARERGIPGYVWNPSMINSNPENKHLSYYPTIPNKYDLLPGEIEDVQIFTNANTSTSINPTVEVGDAWNDYDPKITFQPGRRLSHCHDEQSYAIDVKIFTEGRKIKTSPNAFAIPDRPEHEWLERSMVGQYRPLKIGLIDTADAIIGSMARQSRGMEAKIVDVKRELGVMENVSAEDVATFTKDNEDAAEEAFGFDQDTQVRLWLLKDTGWFSLNRRVTQHLVLRGKEVERRGLWRINLDDPGNADRDLYRMGGPLESVFGGLYDTMRVELRPGKDYELRISMFQGGVPFYRQEDGFFKDKFSKELPVKFSTPSDVDPRSTGQKVFHCITSGAIDKLFGGACW